MAGEFRGDVQLEALPVGNWLKDLHMECYGRHLNGYPTVHVSRHYNTCKMYMYSNLPQPLECWLYAMCTKCLIFQPWTCQLQVRRFWEERKSARAVFSLCAGVLPLHCSLLSHDNYNAALCRFRGCATVCRVYSLRQLAAGSQARGCFQNLFWITSKPQVYLFACRCTLPSDESA